MEIYFDRRTVRELRNAALDAIEDGDYDALSEDLLKTFSDEQTDEIEKRLPSGDFPEFINDILEEWGMDDVDSLFETLENRFAELDIELRFEDVRSEDEEEEEEDNDFDDDELHDSFDDDSIDEEE